MAGLWNSMSGKNPTGRRLAQELHRELRARAASLALPPQHGRAYLGGEGDAAEGARAARLLLSPRLLDLSCAVSR